MPYTIVASSSSIPTVYPQQIRVFRNPRGQKYYYALVTTSSGTQLYKSVSGVTWEFVSTLNSLELMSSLDWYDDGTQLIVYVVYGWVAVTGSRPIYYRRLIIPDDTSVPTIGAEQTVLATAYQGACVIKRDRNGYVHISFMLRRIVTIKGKNYWYGEPRIIGTTSPNPNDAPSWSAVTSIDTHPDTAYKSWYARNSLVMFGGTGDIGGIVYNSRDSAGVIIIKGRDIVSFNGTTYTLGTITTVLSSSVAVENDNNVGFRVVVDASNYAHFVTERTLTNAKIQSLKASASNTVESWASPVTVDDSNYDALVSRVCLSIDKSVTPNKLYAFYVLAGVFTYILRYRSSPTDVISWSSESTVTDDTEVLIYLNSCYERTVSGIEIIYMRIDVPRTVRFYEVVLIVTVDKSDEETYVLTEEGVPINILIPKSDDETYSLIEEGIPLNILIWKTDEETYLLTEEGEVYVVPIAVEKFGEELFPSYEVLGEMKYPSIMPKVVVPVPIAIHSGEVMIQRGTEWVSERKTRKTYSVTHKVVPDGKSVRPSIRAIRPRYGFKVIRNGEVIYKRWKGADILVWRGQMSLAWLISQNAVGSAVGAFRLVISENDVMPDMGDDSGDPEANEFNPIIGTPVTGTWTFEPTVKPSGQFPLSGWLYYEGDITADRNATVRKMGIIDTTPTPNRRIICEDRVVDYAVLLNDVIRIRYWFPLG